MSRQQFFNAIKCQDIDELILCLNDNIDVNMIDPIFGLTAAHLCCILKNKNLLEVLINYGCNLNIGTNNTVKASDKVLGWNGIKGTTPLMISVEKNDIKSIKLILKTYSFNQQLLYELVHETKNENGLSAMNIASSKKFADNDKEIINIFSNIKPFNEINAPIKGIKNNEINLRPLLDKNTLLKSLELIILQINQYISLISKLEQPSENNLFDSSSQSIFNLFLTDYKSLILKRDNILQKLQLN